MRALLYLQLFCLPSPLVSLNLVTMARTRACSKPAGKTKKDLKQQLKAEKQIKKNEKCLEKALSAYQKQGHQTDFDFIIAQLEQTPKWVAPLAQLIRHGAMGVLLKTGSMEAEKTEVRHLGEKWQGKAKRILQLPLEVLVSMLEKAKLKLSEDDATDEARPRYCATRLSCTGASGLPQSVFGVASRKRPLEVCEVPERGKPKLGFLL